MIQIPNRITREFIQAHPELTFVFSCDVHKKSFFGQSYHAFGESNAYPVPVMWKACKSSGFFQNSQYSEIIKSIDEHLEKIPRDKPIIVFPKIGKGHSRMYVYLINKLDSIKHKDIVVNYGN